MNVIKWDAAKTHPVKLAGLYSGLPLSIYHSGRACDGPSTSHSGLWRIFSKSEAHFYDRWPLNPDRADDDDADESEALILGRATHHLLLGQSDFEKEFVVRPAMVRGDDGLKPWQGNRTACRAWAEKAKDAGLTVVTGAQLERVKGMALSLSRHHLVRQGVLNGMIETTMAWRDPETSVWLLNRPDAVPTDSADVVDLKTISELTEIGVRRAIAAGGYHVQAALVRDGFKAVVGQKMASFNMFFVESKRPHCCLMYRMSDEDIELGSRVYRNALHRFVRALNTGSWPGPGGVQTVERMAYLSRAERDWQAEAVREVFE